MESSSLSEAPSSARLHSLDALRGFTMFWILGADAIVHALRSTYENSTINLIATQLTHKDWEGFAFYDLIFPMFVFIVGVSLTFSLSKSLEQHGKRRTCTKVIVRSLILYLLGLFYYAGMPEVGESLRYVGVLQRIAICYLVAGLLFCTVSLRGLIIACAVFLVGYWALMTFVPIPEVGAGHFEQGQNLSDYVDQQYLPGYKWNDDYDPEGLLSTLPAFGTCLLGVFAGILLRSSQGDYRKTLFLILGGLVSLGLGWFWGQHFPIIKQLWTSSYVLFAAGYSALALALFYLIIDIWKLKAWSLPFIWIGTNAIVLYMIDNIVNLRDLAQRIIKGDLARTLAPYADLYVTALVMVFIFLIARFLYQRRIFIRV